MCNRRRFVLMFLVVTSVFALVSCSKNTVKEDEVGVVVNSGGGYKIYKPGEEVSIMPFFQTFRVISTSPVIVSLVGDEGTQIPVNDGALVTIESQIIYSIEDVEKVIGEYGTEDAHKKIREQIKRMVSKLVSEAFARPGSIDDTPHRITVMAETNIKLNEIMNAGGVSVSSFNIRHE